MTRARSVLGVGLLAGGVASLLALGSAPPARAALLTPATATACGWNGSTCTKGNPRGWSFADHSSHPYQRYGPTTNSAFNPEALTLYPTASGTCGSYWYVYVIGDFGGGTTNHWVYIGWTAPGTRNPPWHFSQKSPDFASGHPSPFWSASGNPGANPLGATDHLGGSVQGHITIWTGFTEAWSGNCLQLPDRTIWADKYPTGAATMDLYTDTSPPATPAPRVTTERANGATFTLPGQTDPGNGGGANAYAAGMNQWQVCWWSQPTGPGPSSLGGCPSWAPPHTLDAGNGVNAVQSAPRAAGDWLVLCAQAWDNLWNTTGVMGCTASPPPSPSPPTLTAAPASPVAVVTTVTLTGTLGSGIPSSTWGQWALAIVPAQSTALPADCPTLPWALASAGSITKMVTASVPTDTTYVVVETPVGHGSECTPGNPVTVQWRALPPEPGAGPTIGVQTGPYTPAPADPLAITGLPQNFWVTHPPARVVTTTVGYDGTLYRLTYTPTAITWSFGDGGTATFAGSQLAAGWGARPSGSSVSAVQHSYQTATETESVSGSVVTVHPNPLTFAATATWSVAWREESTGLSGTYGSPVTSAGSSTVAVQQLQSVYGGCGALTATPASPEPAGTTETLTVAGGTCVPAGSPYLFVVFPPGSSSGRVITSGSSPSATWATAGLTPGAYTLQVQIEPPGATQWQLLATAPFALTAPVCTGPTLTDAPAGNVPVGGTTDLLGAAICPAGATPSYRFTATAVTGTVTTIKDWGPASHTAWNTTGLAAGSYTVTMTVATAPGGQGPTTTAYLGVDVVAPSCTGATITSGSGPSLLRATADALSARATCTVPSLVTYQWTANPPGSATWLILGTTTSPTFAWTPGATGLGGYTLGVTVRDGTADPGTSATSSVFVYDNPGLFVPVSAFRACDTRPNSGYQCAGQAPGPEGTLTVQMTGRGIPSANVAAVAVSVSLIAGGSNTNVAIYNPAVPVTSTLSATAAAHTVTSTFEIVPVSPSGTIALTNNAPTTTQIIIDVEGWYAAAPTATYTNAGRLVLVTQGQIAGFQATTAASAVPVLGQGGVPTTGVSAVLLDVYATTAPSACPATADPAGGSAGISTMLYENTGVPATAEMLVPVGANGQILWKNCANGAWVGVAVQGYVESGAAAGYSNAGLYQAASPTQVTSSWSYNNLRPGQSWSVPVAGAGGIAPIGASAVVATVVAQADWAAGPVRWGPSGGTTNYAIDLYGSRVGWLTGSGAIIPLGVGGQAADIYDAGSRGAVNVAVFTSGWFTGRAGPP